MEERPFDPTLKYQCALVEEFDKMAKDGEGLSFDQRQRLIAAVRRA